MSKGDEQTRKLDLLSPDFDALEALTVSRDRVPLPDPNAPIYDNMTWFVETENGIFPRERTTKKKLSSDNAASTSEAKACTAATSSTAKARTSDRLAWNMSSAATESGDPLSQDSKSVRDSVAKTRVHKNALINMDTAVGPLAFLKKCMDEKLRAKVFIRGASSIRGFCIGFVEAFDKHMNLVLKDVYETWKRPRKNHRKYLSVDAADSEKRENADYDEEESVAAPASTSGSALLHKYAAKCGPKEEGGSENACYPIARWVVKRRTKKKDVCERQLHQLLIRGEQVVCVMLER